MNSNNIVTKLQEIVEPFLKKGKVISMEDELVNSLGFESIDIIDMVVHIEDEYSIQFADSELDDFKKVSDIVNSILIKLDGRNN